MRVSGITDDLLYRYMPEAEEQWIQVIEEAGEQSGMPAYSKHFLNVLKRQMHSGRRTKTVRTLFRAKKSAASVILPFIVAIFVVCMSVEATRTIIIEFVEKIYSDCTDYIYNLKDGADAEFHIVEPMYIPDGYTENRREKVFDRGIYIYYQKENVERELEYAQLIADGLTVTLDTEGAMIRQKKIQGIEVEYFINKGIGYVHWTEDNCYYSFIGEVNTRELLKMAESVIKKE